ncbi:MAG: phosphoribosylamine--glycine ligase [Planktomarina sp.]|nr:phosphoribosylamine--glycine ligase [Planktomarina sp.]
MNILILGGGGREHSLAWAIKQNPKCENLFVAPGNAGIVEIAECVPLNIIDGEAVLHFVKQSVIDFVIIGPEAPLVAGVADLLQSANVLCFGPSKAAAQLEASKFFTKSICDAANVPTAKYRHFTKKNEARNYINQVGTPIVIKADGLAAGKGVTVATNLKDALNALEDIFSDQFGGPNSEVVIEDFMEGEEASYFVLCDGNDVLEIGTAQDHKRVGDGDTGKNTGGMGAYSPAPILNAKVAQKAMSDIIKPTLEELVQRGTPYRGILYAGLMIKDDEPKLVEYNVRFGDPECQVLMMRLGAQALDLMLACAEGHLSNARVNWAEDHALTVVMAANGYPDTYAKGSTIRNLKSLPISSKAMCFHAGTTQTSDGIIANGGRVLNITARADTLSKARDQAYKMVAQVDWPEGFVRGDIGWRAL